VAASRVRGNASPTAPGSGRVRARLSNAHETATWTGIATRQEVSMETAFLARRHSAGAGLDNSLRRACDSRAAGCVSTIGARRAVVRCLVERGQASVRVVSPLLSAVRLHTLTPTVAGGDSSAGGVRRVQRRRDDLRPRRLLPAPSRMTASTHATVLRSASTSPAIGGPHVQRQPRFGLLQTLAVHRTRETPPGIQAATWCPLSP
jgi:hypothetical protein